jgi:hypothetical protein
MHMTFGRLGAVDAAAKMSGMEGALPAVRTLPRLDLWRVANVLALAFLVAAWLFLRRFSPDGIDAHAYWMTRDGIEYGVAGGKDAYLYSPAFAQLIRPLTLLPWLTFYQVWMALLILALVYCAGPVLAALILLTPWVRTEVVLGNVHLLMAAALVASVRFPGSWAFLVLTKVTPGVGLLYHALRREWRPVAVALGVTAGIVAVSFLLDPAAWVAWGSALLHSSSVPAASAVPVSLWLRLPLAVVIVAVGAWRGWRWMIVPAVTLAVPVMWGWVPMVALIPFLRRHAALLVLRPDVADPRLTRSC